MAIGFRLAQGPSPPAPFFTGCSPHWPPPSPLEGLRAAPGGSPVAPVDVRAFSFTPQAPCAPSLEPLFLFIFFRWETYLTLPPTGAAEAIPLLNIVERLAATKALREAPVNILGKTMFVSSVVVKKNYTGRSSDL